VYVSSSTGTDSIGCGTASVTACASLRAGFREVGASGTLILAGGLYSSVAYDLAINVTGINVAVLGASTGLRTVIVCSNGSNWLTATHSSIRLDHVSIENCVHLGSGGAISAIASSIELVSVALVNNTALISNANGGGGGAIAMQGNSTIGMTDSTFSGNSVVGMGDCVQSTSCTVRYCDLLYPSISFLTR
jgi:hypothetical protein